MTYYELKELLRESVSMVGWAYQNRKDWRQQRAKGCKCPLGCYVLECPEHGETVQAYKDLIKQ